MTRTPAHLVDLSCSALHELRAQAPLVQCLTNSVVTGFTANVLLALGAAPAMVDLPGEAGPFAGVASGVLVNLGTPMGEQRLAMLEAVDGARRAGTPWVLDPVGIGPLPVRTALSRDLCDLRPDVIRGNASEVLVAAGAGGGGRGVDSVADVETAVVPARDLALRTGGVVAVSGPVDAVTDGRRTVRISNGTPLLTRVTGGGCALGAVMAAFASLDDDRWATTVAACLVYTVAAEVAAESAPGPGSFPALFLDALAAIGPDVLARRAVLS